METQLQHLPLGMQTFEKIRKENCIYVDKTKFLVELIENGATYFFARPRRFGKSLTVSTLEALLSGRKDLFEGLYAEEFMNRPDYRPMPVIRIDMSEADASHGIDAFHMTIASAVRSAAKRLKVELPDINLPGVLFGKLIENASRKYSSRVAILLDEYDKPYNQYVNDRVMAEKIRTVLRSFYERIKINDEYIRFIFITGIAKFAKFSVFSSLNHIFDYSLNKKYGQMYGLTEAEIKQYFPQHIEATASEMNIRPEELLEQMRDYYNGFCFDGIHKVYNPFSTLCFFTERELNNYWIESGSSLMMAEYLKERKLTIEQFRGVKISNQFLRTPGDLDTTVPEGFLYQAGYLTIRETGFNNYTLDYPNTEVLNSMSALLADNILTPDSSFERLRDLMLTAIEENDADEFVDALNALLASIPYDDFAAAGKTNIKRNRLNIQVQEWLYRSTILAFVRGCGIAVVAEMHTNLGRADLVIKHADQTYVIELKVAYTPEEISTKLAEAVQQIKDKNYLAPYPNAKALAIVIDDTKRQISETAVIQ